MLSHAGDDVVDASGDDNASLPIGTHAGCDGRAFTLTARFCHLTIIHSGHTSYLARLLILIDMANRGDSCYSVNMPTHRTSTHEI